MAAPPRSRTTADRLIAVGRLRAGPEAALFTRYNARLRPPLAVFEVAEAAGAPAEIRRREGAAILAALPDRATLLALDQGGQALGSEAICGLLARLAEAGRPLAWAIGGAEGLDPTVLARAAHRLSLGAPTWPHLLVRALLAEQLYRAQTICDGHPYHRAWRP